MADGDNNTQQQIVNIEEIVSRIIARNQNDPREAVRVLSSENFNHRQTIKKQKQAIANLEQRPELKEGQRVISAEDAKLLDDYKAINLPPDKVKEAVTERDTLKAKDAEVEQAKQIAKGVKALRMQPDLMAELVRDKKLQHKLGEREIEGEDGKKETVQVLLVRGSESEEWVSADKYAERNLKGYLPALRLKEGDDESLEEDSGENPDSETEERTPQPRLVPRQSSARGRAPATKGSEDVVAKVQSKYTPPSKLQSQGA